MIKKPTLKFKGTVTLGLFLPDDPEAWARHVSEFDGKEVTTNGVKKYRAYKERSGQQNKYYWGVIVKVLSDELGYTSDEIHEVLKYQFLSDHREFVRKDGNKKLLSVPLSTADLSTLEFETLLSKIRTWASAELQIYLPLPNETPFDYQI